MENINIVVSLIVSCIKWLAANLRVATRLVLALGLLVSSQWVSAQNLTISPITWNVIGLDSNKPLTSGPDTFPVGARVCNTGGATVTNLTGNLNLAAGSTVISVAGASSIVYGTLTSGTATAQSPSQYTINASAANCADFYFNVIITRAASSYGKTRTYTISVTGTSNGSPVSITTAANRELYVEKLVSQNRNNIIQFSGPTTAYVGEVYTYTYVTTSTPGGYDQLENFIAWPSAVFQVLAVSTTYATPVGAVNSTPYADACGWQNNPTLPNYRSCVGPAIYPGGVGDQINTIYTIKVLQVGSSAVTGLVHDFSGSSYHYNSDYGDPLTSLTVQTKLRSADLAVTKTNSLSTVTQGFTTTYSIVFTNAGPEPAITTTIVDPAVTGLTKTSVTCSVAVGGAVCPAAGSVTIAALESGLIIANTPVNSTLTFTVVALVTAGPGTTVTNTVSVIPFTTVVDSNLANNTATDADRVIGLVNLSITKTNGTTTLLAGSTTAYTVTVANVGPADASGSVLKDPAVTGLSCTAVTCTGVTGAAL